MNLRYAVLAALIAAAVCRASAAAETKAMLSNESPEQFAGIAAQVRQEMQAGGHYEYIKVTDKREVDLDLDRMAEMIGKAGSVQAMDQKDKVALFNLQEKLNGLLTSNSSDRLICKHEAPIGSHIPVTTCRTYADTMRDSRDTQKWLKDNQMLQGAIGDPIPGKPLYAGSGH